VIPEVDIAVQVGRDLFLDEKIPRHESGQGYVRVVEHSIMWKEKTASKIFTYQGLTTCTEVDKSWTIMSSTYNHLRQKRGENKSGLGTLIREEVSSIVCTVQSFFASQTLHDRLFFKKKTGDVNDEANFSFFILLHKRAKPILL
jgi:hypothetical protein